MIPNRAISSLRRRQGRRDRRGVALIEVLVVLVILLGVAALVLPAVSSYMQLEQRRAAKELSLTYELLHDQAVMRNVTFRVAFHLDANMYQIEVGDAEVLIFDDPEKREAWEEEVARSRSRFSDDEEAAEAAIQERFQQLQDSFATKKELPRGTRFGGVYTPQYDEMMEPSGVDITEDPDEAVVVYSYIFPNGFTEHTVVQLVDVDDPDSGYTVEIEPLSGRVHMTAELSRWDERFDFVPEIGPELEL